MTTQFDQWLGSWSGAKRLWLSPESDEIDSASHAHVKKIAKGSFLKIEYDWRMEAEDQEGIIILPATVAEQETHSVWIDSWHTRQHMMVCEVARIEGKVSMLGTYHNPPGEDWGWRLELLRQGNDALLVRMFNISPECDECLAVEINYQRSD